MLSKCPIVFSVAMLIVAAPWGDALNAQACGCIRISDPSVWPKPGTVAPLDSKIWLYDIEDAIAADFVVETITKPPTVIAFDASAIVTGATRHLVLTPKRPWPAGVAVGVRRNEKSSSMVTWFMAGAYVPTTSFAPVSVAGTRVQGDMGTSCGNYSHIQITAFGLQKLTDGPVYVYFANPKDVTATRRPDAILNDKGITHNLATSCALPQFDGVVPTKSPSLG
jgi:hypothetical protein